MKSNGLAPLWMDNHEPSILASPCCLLYTLLLKVHKLKYETWWKSGNKELKPVMYAKKCSLSPHFLDDHVRPLASFPGLRLCTALQTTVENFSQFLNSVMGKTCRLNKPCLQTTVKITWLLLCIFKVMYILFVRFLIRAIKCIIVKTVWIVDCSFFTNLFWHWH